MPISFGVEYEFDFIDSRGRVSRGRESYRDGAHIDEWEEHGDCTASVELITPVFTHVDEAFRSTKRQWQNWYRQALTGKSPYPHSRHGRPLGQHIHIGKPRGLMWEEAQKIAKSIMGAYPYFGALHALPLPSDRILNGGYCHEVQPRQPLGDDDRYDRHYMELNYSQEYKTVENRLYDANIPSVSYTIAYISQLLAEKAIGRSLDDITNAWPSTYHDERNKAITQGLRGLDIPYYMRYINTHVDTGELPEIPSVREILYLSVKYQMNPSDVLRWSRMAKYEYFKANLSNPEQYLANIKEGIQNEDKKERLGHWLEEAERVNTLPKLLEIAGITSQIIQEAPSMARAVVQATLDIYRSDVRAQVDVLPILRISETNMPNNEIASQIQGLLVSQGDNYVNIVSETDILTGRPRYYIMVYQGQVIANVAISLRDRLITSIVVDRRFRRLGLGGRLIGHAVEVARTSGLREVSAVVREGNLAMSALLEAQGFVRGRRTEDNTGNFYTLPTAEIEVEDTPVEEEPEPEEEEDQNEED